MNSTALVTFIFVMLAFLGAGMILDARRKDVNREAQAEKEGMGVDEWKARQTLGGFWVLSSGVVFVSLFTGFPEKLGYRVVDFAPITIPILYSGMFASLFVIQRRFVSSPQLLTLLYRQHLIGMLLGMGLMVFSIALVLRGLGYIALWLGCLYPALLTWIRSMWRQQRLDMMQKMASEQ